jgi:hypothetical protein
VLTVEEIRFGPDLLLERSKEFQTFSSHLGCDQPEVIPHRTSDASPGLCVVDALWIPLIGSASLPWGRGVVGPSRSSDLTGAYLQLK